MKIIKLIILSYNAILVFCLITIGFMTSSYDQLAPILLLIPVGTYYGFSLVNKITNIKEHIKIPSIITLFRVLKIYSFFVISLLVIANIALSAHILQATLTLFLLPLLISFILDVFSTKNINQNTLKTILNLTKYFKKQKKSHPKSKTLKLEDSKSTKKHKTKKEQPEKNKKEDAQDSELIQQEQDIEEVHYEHDKAIEGEDVTNQFSDMIDISDHKRRQFLKILGGGGISLFLTLFVFQNKAQAAFFGSAPGPGVVGIKDSDGNKIDPAEKQPTDGYSVTEIDDDATPSYYGFIHKNGSWYIAKEDSSGSYRYASGSSGFSTNWTNRASLTYDYFDTVFG